MGFFDLIAKPFGYLMKFCLWLSPGHNYLVALIFFTLIIQVLLCLLFGIKQQKNMLKQANIAPMAAAIRKKYQGRDDQVTRQKMQEETMALYTKYGYSPLSGCLPMLIQLPVIMALYNVIVAPLQYMLMLTKTEVATILNKFLEGGLLSDAATNKIITEKVTEFAANNVANARMAQVEVINKINEWQASGAVEELNEFAYGISDKLTADTILPKYSVFGFDFSANPPMPDQWLKGETFVNYWPLLLVPVLIVVTMILSTTLSRKFTYQDPTMQQQQNGCSMKVMMYSMPLLLAYISLSLPAAVGVYWIYRSIAATLQQFILSLIMPMPKFTEEDYKNAEKELAGSSKKSKKKNEDGSTSKPGKYAYNEDGTRKRSLHHIDDEDDGAEAPVIQAKAEDDTLAPDVDPANAPVMKDDKGSTTYKKKH